MFFILACSALFFWACQNKAQQGAALLADAQQAWPPSLAWDLASMPNIDVENGDNPQTIIALKLGAKRFALDTITGTARILEKAEQEQHQVPNSAWSACGGFWAGLGVYYYAEVKNEKVEVWVRYDEEGYYDEEKDDFVQSSPQWELKRSFEAKDLN